LNGGALHFKTSTQLCDIPDDV